MVHPLSILEEALHQQVSPINARVVVERSRRTLRDSSRLAVEDRPRFLATVRSTLRLFTGDERTNSIIKDLEHRLILGASRVDQKLLSFTMRDENDLRAARAGARETCLAFASRATDAQRVATAVSELGRNIISYTPGGQIELELRRGPPVRVRLTAVDLGSGITHLDEVLAGRYRSKTGLGRGLLGVKRLMDQFRVQTSEQGTRIEAEVTFSC